MEYLNPGPIDTSLLTMQNEHISNDVWNGIECSFRPRYCFWQSLPSESVLQVIRTTAFGNLLTLGPAEINNHLLLALIERWRPETHTFHFTCGEATITLEDVAYQLGIPIEVEVITGVTSMDWEDICMQLLGAVPAGNELMGQRVKLTWLERTFRDLPDNANDVIIEQHAKAFILRMIGEFLMPDTSGNRVHLMYLPFLDDLTETFQYSWGSAVLACLYRGLCRAATTTDQKEIGGCLLLLQSWAYDRIQNLAPRLRDPTIPYFPLVKRWSQHLITTNIPGHVVNIIRAMFDRMCVDQFRWMPYSQLPYLPNISEKCRSRVPLICFAIVEWHPTDRVMRQFGFAQPIPQDL
ncbi:PREDICTED: serine/threonine-protein phosphatase 7 long form homolog [Lupinus angustifolius]|uniref:serine/threonine-protein phosphatase 7 long form homolog n=1 Tax=Lupinus angustifolius TaxID=3871 RepID=UPI00092E32E0|nr:PREDICTED: serine/threonine-protein phosphatase 7 long form homolog [Lupinus angustifolius]